MIERTHRAARDYMAARRIRLRLMRRGEEEARALSCFRAFRASEPDLLRDNFFTGHPNLAPGDTIVAEVDGRVAGHASGYRFTMALAGHDVPMRGVAAVAVLPEFRRMGVAEALMTGLLRQMKRRGEALSMLYAFRMSFYRKLGYGTVEWGDHLRVTADQLPSSPLRGHVRALDRERDRANLARVYEAWRTAGRSGPFVRAPEWWTRRVWLRVNEGVAYIDPRTRRMAGYALYEVPREPGYPRQHAFVRELVALTPEARRGLLGFFAALGDQFRMLEFAFPRGEGVGLLREFGMVGLPEMIRLGETAGLVAAGAMLRLVDVPQAFAWHPGPARNGARGRLGIDLADPLFPAQSKAFDVTFGPRGARLVPGRAARDRIALDAAQLAQVYGRGASARALLADGMATGQARAAALLDRAFAGPPFFLSPLNGF